MGASGHAAIGDEFLLTNVSAFRCAMSSQAWRPIGGERPTIPKLLQQSFTAPAILRCVRAGHAPSVYV
jgi:hypothetical protein